MEDNNGFEKYIYRRPFFTLLIITIIIWIIVLILTYRFFWEGHLIVFFD